MYLRHFSVISTQTTKQHYIVDAIAGLLLAEGLFALNKRIHVYRYVQNFFTQINQKAGSIIKEKALSNPKISTTFEGEDH